MKKEVYIIMALIFVSVAFATLIEESSNVFTNGLASETFLFEEESNITRYLEIPLSVNVTNLSINVIGRLDSATLYDRYRFIIENCGAQGGQLSWGFGGHEGVNGTGEDVFTENVGGVTFWPGVGAAPVEDMWVYSAGYSDQNLTNLSFITPQSYIFDNDQNCNYNPYLQVNLTTNVSVESFGFGTRPPGGFRYTHFLVNGSRDGVNWETLVDSSFNEDFNGDTLYFYDVDTFPTNVAVLFDDNRNETQSSFVIPRLNTSNSENLSLNITAINEIIVNDCDCEGCSISDYLCTVPILFHSDTRGNISYQSINLSYEFGVDSCTEFVTEALNISFYDLTTNNVVNVNYQNAVNFSNGLDDGSFFINQTNINFTQICVYPEYALFESNLLVQYDNGSSTFEYSTYNTTLDNETDLLFLYLVDGTDQVILTVKDLFGDAVSGALIKILKYDVGTGTYRTTEILETDGDGQTIANIILIDAFYRFIIEVDGDVKLIEPETGGVRVLSTTKNFVINLEGADWFDEYDTTLGASTSLVFSNTSNSFVYTWNDPTSAMHEGCLKVVKRNRTGETQINNTCVSSAASSIVIPISGIQNGSTFIATGYFLFDDEYITDTLIQIYEDLFSFTQLSDEDDVLFMGALLITGITLIGIPFPIVALSLMVLGLIFTMLLGIYKIGIGIIVAIVALVIIQLYKAKT